MAEASGALGSCVIASSSGVGGVQAVSLHADRTVQKTKLPATKKRRKFLMMGHISL